MPSKKAIELARRDAKEGKSPSTQAGEFVREEIDHVRHGKHGVRNTKQAIAIGLSEARRAGVKLPPYQGKNSTQSTEHSKTSPRRSRAREEVLKREPRTAVSRTALSRQARDVSQKRGPVSRQNTARKAAQTRRRKLA